MAAELIGADTFKGTLAGLDAAANGGKGPLAVPATFNPLYQDLLNNDVHFKLNKAERLLLASLLTDGVLDGAAGDFLVTAKVPVAMAVAVAAGLKGAHAGGYFTRTAAGEDLAIAAADQVNPRIDLVEAGFDTETKGPMVKVKQGVPAGAPVAPAVDAGFVAVAEVRVDAGAASIDGADITDRRQQVVFRTAIGAVARSGDTMAGPLTLSGDPTQELHATTKRYVDLMKQGLRYKDACRVATTANVNLAAGGLLTVDGVVLVAGDRVLVKDQAAAAENGIYVAAAGAWSRAADADNSPGGGEVVAGIYTWVTEGATQADSGWVLATNDPIVLDITALSFVQFTGAGQIVAGTGLLKAVNTLSVDVGAGANKVPQRDAYGRVPGDIDGVAAALWQSGVAGSADPILGRITDGVLEFSGNGGTSWVSVEESLYVEAVKAVTGSEATQVETSMGPAIEFIDGSTRSVTFTRLWPWDAYGGKIKIHYAADSANAGSFRVRAAYQINGGAATNVDVTITPGADTALHTADLGVIFNAAAVAAGDMVTITFSRLAADAADTHTGKMRLYSLRFGKV